MLVCGSFSISNALSEFYNNCSATPKGREVRDELIDQKAKAMNCTFMLIYQWMKAFRQYYVKLKMLKVGVSQQSLTARQAFTLSRGKFLDSYVKKTKKSSASARDTSSDDSLVSQAAGDDDESDHTAANVSLPPIQPIWADMTNKRQGFQMFLGYKFNDVPDHLWEDFEIECLAMIRRYRAAGMQQQAGIQQPPQQPLPAPHLAEVAASSPSPKVGQSLRASIKRRFKQSFRKERKGSTSSQQ